MDQQNKPTYQDFSGLKTHLIGKQTVDQYRLTKSTRKNKKYTLTTPDNKHIHFGDNRYEDYTQHKDQQRKTLYVNRHQKKEQRFWLHNKNNLQTPAYLSRYLLWESPNLNDAIRSIESSHGYTISITKDF